MDLKHIILPILLCLSPISFAEYGLLYSLEFSYDGNSLSYGSVHLVQGDAPDLRAQPPDGFTLNVVSISGAALYTRKFSLDVNPRFAPPSGIFDAFGNQIADAPPVEAEANTSFALAAPYFADASRIEIIGSSGTRMLSIDVSGFAPKNKPAAPGASSPKQLLNASAPAQPGATAPKAAVPQLFLFGVIVAAIIAVAYVLTRREKKK